MIRTIASALLVVVALTWMPVITSKAHEGPPFPIVIDREVGPYVVSIWTDPDIGIGTFFVVIEPGSDERLPDVSRVQVGVQPVDGHLDEAVYDAEDQNVRYGARYLAEVPFDSGGTWNVRIVIDGAEGGGEIRTEVEPTPDGTIGPIGLIVYALPFLAVAFLWIKAAMRRRQPSA